MIITEIKHLNVRISVFEDPIFDENILPVFITPLILKEVEARKKSKYKIETLNPEKKLTFKIASFNKIVEELSARIKKIAIDLEPYYFTDPSYPNSLPYKVREILDKKNLIEETKEIEEAILRIKRSTVKGKKLILYARPVWKKSNRRITLKKNKVGIQSSQLNSWSQFYRYRTKSRDRWKNRSFRWIWSGLKPLFKKKDILKYRGVGCVNPDRAIINFKKLKVLTTNAGLQPAISRIENQHKKNTNPVILTTLGRARTLYENNSLESKKIKGGSAAAQLKVKSQGLRNTTQEKKQALHPVQECADDRGQGVEQKQSTQTKLQYSAANEASNKSAASVLRSPAIRRTSLASTVKKSGLKLLGLIPKSKGALMILDDEGWDLDLLLNKNSVFQHLKKRRPYSLRKLRRLRRLRRLRLMSINLYLHRSKNMERILKDQECRGRNNSKLEVQLSLRAPVQGTGGGLTASTIAPSPAKVWKSMYSRLMRVETQGDAAVSSTLSGKRAVEQHCCARKNTFLKNLGGTNVSTLTHNSSSQTQTAKYFIKHNDNKLKYVLNLIGGNLSYPYPGDKASDQRLNKKNISEIFLVKRSEPIELPLLEMFSSPAWDLEPVKIKENSTENNEARAEPATAEREKATTIPRSTGLYRVPEKKKDWVEIATPVLPDALTMITPDLYPRNFLNKYSENPKFRPLNGEGTTAAQQRSRTLSRSAMSTSSLKAKNRKFSTLTSAITTTSSLAILDCGSLNNLIQYRAASNIAPYSDDSKLSTVRHSTDSKPMENQTLSNQEGTNSTVAASFKKKKAKKIPLNSKKIEFATKIFNSSLHDEAWNIPLTLLNRKNNLKSAKFEVKPVKNSNANLTSNLITKEPKEKNLEKKKYLSAVLLRKTSLNYVNSLLRRRILNLNKNFTANSKKGKPSLGLRLPLARVLQNKILNKIKASAKPGAWNKIATLLNSSGSGHTSADSPKLFWSIIKLYSSSFNPMLKSLNKKKMIPGLMGNNKGSRVAQLKFLKSSSATGTAPLTPMEKSLKALDYVTSTIDNKLAKSGLNISDLSSRLLTPLQPVAGKIKTTNPLLAHLLPFGGQTLPKRASRRIKLKVEELSAVQLELLTRVWDLLLQSEQETISSQSKPAIKQQNLKKKEDRVQTLTSPLAGLPQPLYSHRAALSPIPSSLRSHTGRGERGGERASGAIERSPSLLAARAVWRSSVARVQDGGRGESTGWRQGRAENELPLKGGASADLIRQVLMKSASMGPYKTNPLKFQILGGKIKHNILLSSTGRKNAKKKRALYKTIRSGRLNRQADNKRFLFLYFIVPIFFATLKNNTASQAKSFLSAQLVPAQGETAQAPQKTLQRRAAIATTLRQRLKNLNNQKKQLRSLIKLMLDSGSVTGSQRRIRRLHTRSATAIYLSSSTIAPATGYARPNTAQLLKAVAEPGLTSSLPFSADTKPEKGDIKMAKSASKSKIAQPKLINTKIKELAADQQWQRWPSKTHSLQTKKSDNMKLAKDINYFMESFKLNMIKTSKSKGPQNINSKVLDLTDASATPLMRAKAHIAESLASDLLKWTIFFIAQSLTPLKRKKDYYSLIFIKILETRGFLALGKKTNAGENFDDAKAYDINFTSNAIAPVQKERPRKRSGQSSYLDNSWDLTTARGKVNVNTQDQTKKPGVQGRSQRPQSYSLYSSVQSQFLPSLVTGGQEARATGGWESDGWGAQPQQEEVLENGIARTVVKNLRDQVAANATEPEKQAAITFYSGGRFLSDWKRVTRLIWQEDYKFKAVYLRMKNSLNLANKNLNFKYKSRFAVLKIFKLWNTIKIRSIKSFALFKFKILTFMPTRKIASIARVPLHLRVKVRINKENNTPALYSVLATRALRVRGAKAVAPVRGRESGAKEEMEMPQEMVKVQAMEMEMNKNILNNLPTIELIIARAIERIRIRIRIRTRITIRRRASILQRHSLAILPAWKKAVKKSSLPCPGGKSLTQPLKYKILLLPYGGAEETNPLYKAVALQVEFLNKLKYSIIDCYNTDFIKKIEAKLPAPLTLKDLIFHNKYKSFDNKNIIESRILDMIAEKQGENPNFVKNHKKWNKINSIIKRGLSNIYTYLDKILTRDINFINCYLPFIFSIYNLMPYKKLSFISKNITLRSTINRKAFRVFKRLLTHNKTLPLTYQRVAALPSPLFTTIKGCGSPATNIYKNINKNYYQPELEADSLKFNNKLKKSFNNLVNAKSTIIGKIRSIKLVELIDKLKEEIIIEEKLAALVRVADITVLNFLNKKKYRRINASKYLNKKKINRSNRIKILQTIETIKTEFKFEPKLDSNSLSNIPVSLLYYSNLKSRQQPLLTGSNVSSGLGGSSFKNGLLAPLKGGEAGGARVLRSATFVSVDKHPVISAYLRELSIYNRKTKGIINYFSRIVGYNFNTHTNKISSTINDLLEASFRAMRCLISKPVFVITPKKIKIQLFYFILAADKKKLKKMKYKFKWNKRKRRVYNKARARLARKLNLFSLNQVYPKQFELLCSRLNKIFNKPIELNLIRLHYPSEDTNILVNLMGIIVNKVRIRKIFKKLFAGSIIRTLTKIKAHKYNDITIIPAFLTGLSIKVAGRIMTQRIKPRKTINLIRRGVTASGKINYLNFARLTKKNKRGSYSITISAGQNFF